VSRKLPGYDEYRVDPDGVTSAGVSRSQALGRNRYPAKAIFVESPGSSISRCALLYFDEGDDLTAADNQVDFAAWNARTLSEDPPALEAQPPGRDRLRPASARFGQLPVQSLPPSSSARA
jgi:hypothetical protein